MSRHSPLCRHLLLNTLNVLIEMILIMMTFTTVTCQYFIIVMEKKDREVFSSSFFIDTERSLFLVCLCIKTALMSGW